MPVTRTDAQLFTEDPETGCWNFLGSLNSKGYGGIKRNGVHIKAHRYFFEKYNRPITPGMVLDHICRNPSCVKPSHLREVTVAQNTQLGDLAKLTHNQVKEIIHSPHTQAKLAEFYGVCQQQISKIKSGKRWGR